MSDNVATAPHNVQNKPEVILMNGAWLAQAKADIASGNPALRDALSKLLHDANSALDNGPFSVVDKTRTPPSGNKHDYMSTGSYWWPDPTKKNGLPYIRRDGETNPESRSDADDRLRLEQMCKTIETLSLACYFSIDKKYAERAIFLLRTWFLNANTMMNPHLEYGQAIPGLTNGRGIGIIDTRFLTTIVDATGLLAHASALTTDDQMGLRKWFKSYLDWLLTSKHGQEENRAENNHGTWYDAQVVNFALFVGKKNMAKKVLESAKSRRIATQIQPDGKQPLELARTRSFDYSTINLTALFALARFGEHTGVDLWHYTTPDMKGIHAALDYLIPYADNGKEWPYKQITEIRRSMLLPLLQQGKMVYGTRKYLKMISKLPKNDVRGQRCLLLYPISAIQPAAPKIS